MLIKARSEVNASKLSMVPGGSVLSASSARAPRSSLRSPLASGATEPCLDGLTLPLDLGGSSEAADARAGGAKGASLRTSAARAKPQTLPRLCIFREAGRRRKASLCGGRAQERRLPTRGYACGFPRASGGPSGR